MAFSCVWCSELWKLCDTSSSSNRNQTRVIVVALALASQFSCAPNVGSQCGQASDKRVDAVMNCSVLMFADIWKRKKFCSSLVHSFVIDVRIDGQSD